MVTISNADKALKTFYLGVLADQLNVGVNPLFAKIAQTSSDVWGKEIKKLAPYGINGGVGSGEENDNLPQSGGNNYAQFTLTLKNLFGKIEISDKAPQDYVSHYRQKLGEEGYRKACEEHALPDNFETMDYMEFLNQRRILMAQTVRKAYVQLCE